MQPLSMTAERCQIFISSSLIVIYARFHDSNIVTLLVICYIERAHGFYFMSIPDVLQMKGE